MRACRLCGHDNADHLPYCSRCGRRLEALSAEASAGGGGAGPASAGGSATVAGVTMVDAVVNGSGVMAPTVAVTPAPGGAIAAATPAPPSSSPARRARRGPVGRALESVRYVFVFVRGKLDAEEQRRRLVDEREGARRLQESALIDVGSAVLREGVSSQELVGLLEALGRAQAQREAALSDLGASEKLQAAEDLRLGMHEAAAEAEWKACEGGARDVEELLRQSDKEKQEAAATAGAAAPADRLGAELRLSTLDAHYSALRERAAALRASTLAARSKLDQAVAARRHAAAAMAASITGHTRQRAEAERQIRELTAQVGRAAFQARLPSAPLLPAYWRVERLEETIAERDRQIALVARAARVYDPRKLATGVGLLTGLVGAVGVVLWALLR